MARDGFTVTGRKVTFAMSTASGPPRPGQRLRQDGAGRARARASPRPGSRSSPPGPPRPGCATAGRAPSPAVEEVTGFPECLEGRVKTLHPEVHAGRPRRPAQARPRRAARRPGHRPVRARGGEPLPVHRHGRLRRRAGRVRRADRHRRPDDGPRRGEEPPAASPWSSTRPATTTCSRPCRPAGSPSSARTRLAAEAFAHTAAYDVAVATWMASTPGAGRRRGFPAFLGAALHPRRRAPLRREPAPAGRALRRRPTPTDTLAGAEQLHGKAMSYNNYVDTDAALRAA